MPAAISQTPAPTAPTRAEQKKASLERARKERQELLEKADQKKARQELLEKTDQKKDNIDLTIERLSPKLNVPGRPSDTGKPAGDGGDVAEGDIIVDVSIGLRSQGVWGTKEIAGGPLDLFPQKAPYLVKDNFDVIMQTEGVQNEVFRQTLHVSPPGQGDSMKAYFGRAVSLGHVQPGDDHAVDVIVGIREGVDESTAPLIGKVRIRVKNVDGLLHVDFKPLDHAKPTPPSSPTSSCFELSGTPGGFNLQLIATDVTYRGRQAEIKARRSRVNPWPELTGIWEDGVRPLILIQNVELYPLNLRNEPDFGDENEQNRWWAALREHVHLRGDALTHVMFRSFCKRYRMSTVIIGDHRYLGHGLTLAPGPIAPSEGIWASVENSGVTSGKPDTEGKVIRWRSGDKWVRRTRPDAVQRTKDLTDIWFAEGKRGSPCAILQSAGGELLLVDERMWRAKGKIVDPTHLSVTENWEWGRPPGLSGTLLNDHSVIEWGDGTRWYRDIQR